MVNLDGIRMRAEKTAANGVINKKTIFHFHQKENCVWAEYAGGRVARGYLVGLLSDDKLEFRYCQMDSDGKLDGGVSVCDVELDPSHRIRLIEHFEWESRAGSGTNVIQQILD